MALQDHIYFGGVVNYRIVLSVWIFLFVDISALFGVSKNDSARRVIISDSEYSVQQIYDTDRGLPANGATSVIQDKNGYIWASTFNGLVRYDGYRFNVFNTNNVEGLGSNRFLTVIEGSNGRIIAGLEHGGLLIKGPNHSEVHHIDPEIYGTNISINAIYEDEYGTLWIGTEMGIFHFRDGVFVKVNSSTLDEFSVTMTQMIYNHEGAIYILFSNAFVKYDKDVDDYHLLALFDRNEESLTYLNLFESGPDQRTGVFWQVHHLDENEYLLIHDEGVFHLSDKGIETVITSDELNSTMLYGMVLFNNRYYIYGSEGVFSTDNLFSDEPEFIRYNQISVSFATTDHEGNIWLSTHAYGLIQLRETPVYRGETFDAVSHVPITAVLGSSDDVLYVGTNCDALYAFDGVQIRQYSVNEGIRNHCVWSLLEQSDGSLWVGTWGDGVYVRRPGSELFEVFRPEIMQDAMAVLAMFEDSKGNLWFGSYYNGLFVYDGEEVVRVLNSNGRTLSAVRMIYEDRDGKIYVASDMGIGILNDDYHIDKPEQLKRTRTLNFRTIAEDRNSRLWFGSYGGGIVILDGEEIYTLTEENGLYDNTVSQLNFDEDGDLWLAGNLGVFTIENSELDSFLNGEKNQIRVTRFGQNDGLHVVETTGGFTPSSYLSDEGELFIPTVRGLVKIETGRYDVNWSIPMVYLEGIEIDGRVYRPDEIESISYSDRRILFQFSVLSYRNPSNVEVEYILDGFDDEWQRVSGSREALYTTLPQGRYTFRVRGSNNDGIWNEQGAIFTFQVLPPFWLTWWFYLLIALLLIIGVYIVYRNRVSSIEKYNRELERKVEVRTEELKEANDELKQLILEKNKMQRVLGHDLRNPLSGIIGYMELLISDDEIKVNKDNKKMMDLLLQSSRDTLNLLENLLHFSGSTREALEPQFKKTSIRQLALEAIKIIEVQANQKEINIELNCENPVNAEVDQNMMLSVMRNLISNAVKFSPVSSSVRVSANIDENENNLIISVADRGIGMNPDKIERLFTESTSNSQPGTQGEKGMGVGLQICNDFVNKHKGSIQVESEPGKGSTFTVIIPAKQ